MARILLTWELGGGLGHVGPLRAIGAELVSRKHVVALATPRDNLPLCEQALAGAGVILLPAPRLAVSHKRLKVPCTYTDVLHDCGYSSADNVVAAVSGWLNSIDRFQPDFVIADHAPTALVACRARGLVAAPFGWGFVCPPDVTPLPSLHREITEPHWAEEVEATVLASMNTALRRHGGPVLSYVAELFAAAEAEFLMTLRELDQYAAWRVNPDYRRPVGALPGQTCHWPKAEDDDSPPHLLVYLRDQATLSPLLAGLAYKNYPTVCYAPRIPDSDRAALLGSSVFVSTTPIDLVKLLDRCDAALLHGGHGTVSTMLLAGVPMLLLPTMLEQRVTADRIVELGVGLSAPPNELNAIATNLEDLLGSSRFDESAKTLASEFPPESEAETVACLASRIESLSASRD